LLDQFLKRRAGSRFRAVNVAQIEIHRQRRRDIIVLALPKQFLGEKLASHGLAHTEISEEANKTRPIPSGRKRPVARSLGFPPIG
jgi:hypothetical protein